MTRCTWLTGFVAHVLQRGFADDPAWACDVAEEVYPAWAGCAPEIAADWMFDGARSLRPGDPERTLH